MRKLSPLMRLGLLAGPLLTMVDSSIVNVAVPDIARELGAGLATTHRSRPACCSSWPPRSARPSAAC